jgi:hypothetical protein
LRRLGRITAAQGLLGLLHRLTSLLDRSRRLFGRKAIGLFAQLLLPLR